MNNFTIRHAFAEDAGRIADFSRQTFYETFARYNTKENMDMFMNEQFSKEKLMAEVGVQGNIFFIALDKDELVGYVRLRESENPKELGHAHSLEIVRIYSATNSIGKGVGKLLMQKSLDIAEELNKEVVWLGVWEHNQRAIEFYTKWGFEKFGTHIFLLGYDVQTDWLMKKDLK